MKDIRNKEVRFAIVDIGTNSIHLLVCEIDTRGHITILDSDKSVTRLGVHIDQDSILSDLAISKTVSVLEQMKSISSIYQPIYKVIATHPARVIKNFNHLKEAVFKATMLDIVVIDGIEEARLVSLGMCKGLSLENKSFLGVDIGGGSTEITICEKGNIIYATSLPIGSVVLNSKFFSSAESFLQKDIISLEKYLAMQIAPIASQIQRYSFDIVVISSGAAKTLAQMHFFEKKDEILEDPNGYILHDTHINKLFKKIKSLKNIEKIKKQWKIEKKRAEIILSGAAILTTLSKLFGVKQWTISAYGLREGLALDCFWSLNSNSDQKHRDVRFESVKRFSEKFCVDIEQSVLVTTLSEKLYCSFKKIKEFKHFYEQPSFINSFELLKYSAWLHECGKFICFPGFHKHSLYLLSNSRMMGFSHRERIMIGMVIRFHRKSLASAKNKECLDFSQKEILKINFMASIVRIAASAYRSRKKIIYDIKPTIEANKLNLKVYTNNNKDLPFVDFDRIISEKKNISKSLMIDINSITHVSTD